MIVADRFEIPQVRREDFPATGLQRLRLELQHQVRPGPERCHHVFQTGYLGARPVELRIVALIDAQWPAENPRRVGIVQHHRMPLPRPLYVQLYTPHAGRQTLAESRQGVLPNRPIAVVLTTVGDDSGRTHYPRIGPRTRPGGVCDIHTLRCRAALRWRVVFSALLRARRAQPDRGEANPGTRHSRR